MTNSFGVLSPHYSKLGEFLGGGGMVDFAFELTGAAFGLYVIGHLSDGFMRVGASGFAWR